MTIMMTLAAWIKLLPTFVNMAIEAWKAIQSGLDWMALRHSMREFTQAAIKAKTTKDTSDLEDKYAGK